MQDTRTKPSPTIPTARILRPKRTLLERLLTTDAIGDPVQFMAGGALHVGTVAYVSDRCIVARASNGTMYSMSRKSD